MPLKTFTNLPEARRKEIFAACMEEFVQNGFQGASLSRIIRRLGLAKGSFYRYFESKRSLYADLIEYASASTSHIIKETFSKPAEDILDTWVEFYLACARQDNSDPLLGYFGYRLSLDKNNPILGDVPLETLKKGTALLRDLFLRHQREGRIRADLDVERMIFVLLKVQSGFIEYLGLKHGIDFEDNIRRGKPLFPLSEEILRGELEGFARILKSGFHPEARPKGKDKSHADEPAGPPEA